MDTQKAIFARDEYPDVPSAVSSYEWRDFEWQLLELLMKAESQPIFFAGQSLAISRTQDSDA